MNLCKTCGTMCPFDDEHEECDEANSELPKPNGSREWLAWLKQESEE